MNKICKIALSKQQEKEKSFQIPSVCTEELTSSQGRMVQLADMMGWDIDISDYSSSHLPGTFY